MCFGRQQALLRLLEHLSNAGPYGSVCIHTRSFRRRPEAPWLYQHEAGRFTTPSQGDLEIC